jgi:hypothetical protein
VLKIDANSEISRFMQNYLFSHNLGTSLFCERKTCLSHFCQMTHFDSVVASKTSEHGSFGSFCWWENANLIRYKRPDSKRTASVIFVSKNHLFFVEVGGFEKLQQFNLLTVARRPYLLTVAHH